MRITSILLSLFVFSSLLSCTEAEEKAAKPVKQNLLKFSSFEEESENEVPKCFSFSPKEGTAVGEIADGVARTGKKSFHIKGGTKPGGDAVAIFMLNGIFEVGKEYTFSCYVKTKDFKGRVRLLAGQYPPPFKWAESSTVKKAAEWRRIAAVFKAKEGLTSIQFRLFAFWRGKDAGGDLWADDFSLVEGAYPEETVKRIAAAQKKAGKYSNALVKPPTGKDIPNPTIDPLKIDYKEHSVEIKDFKFFKADWPEADFTKGVPLLVTRKSKVSLKSWSYYAGVPFAKGALDSKDKVVLSDGTKEIPVQTEVLAMWGPEGTEDGKFIKWLGVNFSDEVLENIQKKYILKIAAEANVPEAKIKVEETPENIVVDNGMLELTISKNKFNILDQVKLGDKQVLTGSNTTGAYLSDSKGRVFYAAQDIKPLIEIEKQGPLKLVIRAEGWFVNPETEFKEVAGEPFKRPKGGFCRFITRLNITAGQPFVKVQHTFIFTEDSDKTQYGRIGIELPIAEEDGSDIRFGSCGEKLKGHNYLLQKLFDKFEVRKVTAAGNTEKIAEGTKASGWLRAGKLAVSVDDFWENYPNELEINPAKNRMYIHFWPEHGVKRQDTLADINHENGFRLPFAHTGRYLDFRFPAEPYDSGKVFKKKILYSDGAKVSNAFGVSKTQELMISFGDKEFTKRQELFTSTLPVYCDPKYLEYTKAVPFLTASDPDNYPVIEKWMYSGINYIKRIMKSYNSYGKWINSSTSDFFQWDGDKIFPHNRRLFSGHHHNKPRVIWWLYLRNGDPELLDLARANTRFCQDIYLCHWTSEEFSKRNGYSKKMIGGMCDYKGIVPWHTGARACYNSMVEHLLLDYYINGNRRAYEAASEHASHLVKNGNDRGREVAGRLNALVNYYRASWNPEVGKAVDTLVSSVLKVRPDHDHCPWWAPWYMNYYNLTGSEEIKTHLKGWADSEINIMIDDVIAGAYYSSGDKAYAKRTAANIMNWASCAVSRKDDLDGLIEYGWGVTWSFPVMKAIIAMQAVKNSELKIQDIAPKLWFRSNYGIQAPKYIRNKKDAEYCFGDKYPWPEQDIRRVEAVIYHDGIKTTLRLGNRQQSKDSTIEVFDPAGRSIKKLQLEGQRSFGYRVYGGNKPRKTVVVKTENGKTTREEITYKGMPGIWEQAAELFELNEAHAKGHYKIVYKTAGDYSSFQLVPPLDPEQMTWFKIGKESTMELSGTKYFWVPEGTKEFELHFLPAFNPASNTRRKVRLAAGVVYGPDTKPVKCFSTGIEKTPVVVKINPRKEDTGKAWFFNGRLISLVKAVGIPEYISPTYVSFESDKYIPNK
ncbi:MAG: exo-rhamnogalacturonan lyase family protein [Planctomycetota bacterium]|jgi:hypothetical protein